MALVEAQWAYQVSQDADEAKILFLDIMDRSARGLEATMRGTPYV